MIPKLCNQLVEADDSIAKSSERPAQAKPIDFISTLHYLEVLNLK